MLTAECWALLKAIGGAGPISIAEAAARAGRDEVVVRGHIEALVQAGILDEAGQGSIEFPYDTVKVELLRRGAATAKSAVCVRPGALSCGQIHGFLPLAVGAGLA